MAVVTLEQIKVHLNLTGSDDDALLNDKVAAAQDHVERLLGFQIETEYPDGGPPSLKQAVLMLASWWYEQREAALTGTIVASVPHGVQEIVTEYRKWSFGDGE